MSYNPIIKGFNTSWKLIGRGFARTFAYGIKVGFCRVTVEPFICQKLSVDPYLDQKVCVL